METNNVTVDIPVMSRDEAQTELDEHDRWLNTFNTMQQQHSARVLRQVRLMGYLEGLNNADKLQTINVVAAPEEPSEPDTKAALPDVI